jgi:hypothetical protein
MVMAMMITPPIRKVKEKKSTRLRKKLPKSVMTKSYKWRVKVKPA